MLSYASRIVVASRSTEVLRALSSSIRTLVPPEDRPARIDAIEFANPLDLADRLSELPWQHLAHTLAVVDVEREVQPWSTSRLGTNAGICTLLMLAFPEVQFAFLDRECRARAVVPERLRHAINTHSIRWDQFPRLVERVRRHRRGYRTLYDPTGLRSWLGARVMSVDGAVGGIPGRQRSAPYLQHSISRSRRLAVAVDDEASYAFMSGYALYRSGFGCLLVATSHEFEEFVSSLRTPVGAHRPHVIVSDWDLAFADHMGVPREPGLDDLVLAGANCPFVVVSSFVSEDGDSPPERFAAQRGGFAKSKAHCGCFDLLAAVPSSGQAVDNPLYQRLVTLTSRSTSAVNRLIGAGSASRHSAPNGAQVVAELLLRRARSVFEDACGRTVAEAMCTAAVLASDAKELGSGGSPATTWAALGLQHRAEVRAELAVLGVATTRSLEARLGSLRSEASLIARVAAGASLPVQSLNALASITGDLRVLFIGSEQNDAAEVCLRHFARMEAEIRTATRKTRRREPTPDGRLDRAGGFIARPLGTYMDWATRCGTSMARLVSISAIAIAVFGVLFALWSATFYPRPVSTSVIWRDSILQASLGFLEVAPGRQAEELGITRVESPAAIILYWFLVLAEDVIAYLHLGLFLSLAYRRITRRAT